MEDLSISQTISQLKHRCCDTYEHCTNCVSFREKANPYGGTDTIKWCEFDTMLSVMDKGKTILELTNLSYLTKQQPTIQTTLSLE